MSSVKVKDHPDLRKDTYSKAILRVNPEAVRRHAHYKQGVDEQRSRDERLAKLEGEMSDIKRMLEQLLAR